MNNDQFYIIKEKLTDIVLEYELLQRKSDFLKNSYLVHFGDLLLEELRITSENKCMLQAIKNKIDIKDVNDAEVLIEKSKIDYEKEKGKLENKISFAVDLDNKCKKYTPDYLNTLDTKYLNYCKEYHPAIKGHSTENERKLYSILSTVYRICDLVAFEELLEDGKKYLTSCEIEESEYDLIASYYNESINNLSELISNMKNSFPINSEEMFSNDALIVREYGRLRQRNYTLKEMNKELHKDFELNYSFDFKF